MEAHSCITAGWLVKSSLFNIFLHLTYGSASDEVTKCSLLTFELGVVHCTCRNENSGSDLFCWTKQEELDGSRLLRYMKTTQSLSLFTSLSMPTWLLSVWKPTTWVQSTIFKIIKPMNQCPPWTEILRVGALRSPSLSLACHWPPEYDHTPGGMLMGFMWDKLMWFVML